MSDATDNVVSVTTTQLVPVSGAITDTNPLDNMTDSRINQQRLVSGAVKPAALSTNLIQVVRGTPGSIYLPDGNSAQFLFTLSNNNNNLILAVPSVSFFIGGDNLTGAHWPGKQFGEGAMPTSVFNDDYFSDGNNTVTQAVIRNNSGSTQLVYCYCNWRVVINTGSQGDVLLTPPDVPVGGKGGIF